MLSIILSVLLAGIPVLPRPHEDVNMGGAKIDPSQPPAVEIHTAPDGQGWRIPIMSGDAHNNLIWIDANTLGYLGADNSGDATNYFEGASAWYSTDGGQTWEKYNINSTLINRSYPDAYYDPITGTPWYAYQIRVAGTPSIVYVAKDEGVALGAPGLFTGSQVTNGEGTYGEWLPTVVAKGDTVVVSYMKYDLGVGACKTSFDGGATWGNEVIIDENQVLDNPNLLLVGENTLVFFSFDPDVIDTIIFWKSNDWGQTWEGPFKLESSAAQYGFASWWYSYVGVAYQGKAHVLAVMGPAGIENGALYDYVFDPADNSITEEFVLGDIVPVIDTTTGDTTGWDIGIPQARTPSVAVTQDGSKLVAMFMNYEETGTYSDLYFMVYDGSSWSEYAPIFAVQDTFDEGRGDFCPVVYDDGDYLNLYFVCSSGSNNYANVYFASSQVVIPSVDETRPSFAFSVRPTIVTGNMNVEFALPKASNVDISVYNVSGQKVKTLYSGSLNAGSHRMSFDSSFGKGIYFVTVTVDGKSTARKIVVK
ncbi:MAG: T9SS type A sorting domain-containing protein [bacterium]|nr:T9SS type A sorting domain-containing protein [bacterium]